MKLVLSFTYPLVIPNLYDFLLSLKRKEGILKKVGYQFRFPLTYTVWTKIIQWKSKETKLFGYQHSSKYILCYAEERKSYSLEQHVGE